MAGCLVLGEMVPPQWAIPSFGVRLTTGPALAILHGWVFSHRVGGRFAPEDVLMVVAAVAAVA